MSRTEHIAHLPYQKRITDSCIPTIKCQSTATSTLYLLCLIVLFLQELFSAIDKNETYLKEYLAVKNYKL